MESGYYPSGAEFDSSAPYNQTNELKSFEVLVSQSLSKYKTVDTQNFIRDGDFIDTSDTNWYEEYSNSYFFPLQLIGVFKSCLEKMLVNNDTKYYNKTLIKSLINECSDWDEDESNVILD